MINNQINSASSHKIHEFLKIDRFSPHPSLRSWKTCKSPWPLHLQGETVIACFSASCSWLFQAVEMMVKESTLSLRSATLKGSTHYHRMNPQRTRENLRTFLLLTRFPHLIFLLSTQVHSVGAAFSGEWHSSENIWSCSTASELSTTLSPTVT